MGTNPNCGKTRAILWRASFLIPTGKTFKGPRENRINWDLASPSLCPTKCSKRGITSETIQSLSRSELILAEMWLSNTQTKYVIIYFVIVILLVCIIEEKASILQF